MWIARSWAPAAIVGKGAVVVECRAWRGRGCPRGVRAGGDPAGLRGPSAVRGPTVAARTQPIGVRGPIVVGCRLDLGNPDGSIAVDVSSPRCWLSLGTRRWSVATRATTSGSTAPATVTASGCRSGARTGLPRRAGRSTDPQALLPRTAGGASHRRLPARSVSGSPAAGRRSTSPRAAVPSGCGWMARRQRSSRRSLAAKTWTVAARRAASTRSATTTVRSSAAGDGGPGAASRRSRTRTRALVSRPRGGRRLAPGYTYAYGPSSSICTTAPSLRRAPHDRARLEEYLCGLGEVPSSWPMRRCAPRRSPPGPSRRTGSGVGLRGDVRLSHRPTARATRSTWGRPRRAGSTATGGSPRSTTRPGDVVTYGGTVIQAFYAASDGGHSENVEDVWHGGNPAYAIPWLAGVCDPGESTSANPGRTGRCRSRRRA